MVLLAALFGIITLNSCKDDEEVPGGGTEIVEDGLYVTGAASSYATPNLKGLMTNTFNDFLADEGNFDDRASLYNAFVVLKAGSNFNISIVEGGVQTNYGPGTDWVTEMGGQDEPQVDLQRGSIVEGGAFTVPADGLYHVIYDTDVKRGAVVPVNWGIIGSATPTGWSGDTEMEKPAFDASTMTWNLNDVTLKAGEWKFRYSGGWKLVIDTTAVLSAEKKGVRVSTNFGNALDAKDPFQAFSGTIVRGGTNFAEGSGIYNFTMTWTEGSGFTATVERIGDVPPRDYSAVSVGLIGDGVKNGTWGENLFNSTPSKDGDVYTWNFNSVELVSTSGFKIRTAGTWDDINVGYNADILGGPDAGDIEGSNDTKDGGDMKAKADGTYDIVFVIDAKAETMSVSFTKK